MSAAGSNQTKSDSTAESGSELDGTGDGDPNLQLSIDRLTLLLDIPNSEYRKATINTVKALPSWNGSWRWASASNIYRCSIHRTAHPVLVQTDPFSPSKPAVRIEFNPNKVGFIGTEVIAADLHSIVIDLPTVLNTATRVSRLDVAIDIHGVKLDEVVVRAAHAQIINPFSRAGVLQTLYFGSPKGARQLAVYDKAAELEAHGCKPLPCPILRIERRLTASGGKAPKFLDLPNQKNPFDGVSIARLDQLGPGLPEPQRTFFLDSARFRGAQAALKLVPAHMRPTYWPEDLDPPDWWEPGKIWSMWPGVVATQIFKPFNAGIAAPGPVISTAQEPCSMVSGP